jgi:hypothetical protein
MALYLGDVKSNVATESALVVGSPARVRGIYYAGGANAGSIVVKNGGSGGSAVITIAVPANGYGNVTIPGDGVLCGSNVYVALANVTSATVFYG